MKNGEEATAEDLALRVSKRDAGAIAELYDRFAPRLLGLLVKILPERAEAEEVLVEVFVHFWREAPRIELSRSSVAAGLAVTARAAALERLRRQKKLPPRGNQEPVLLETMSSWLPRPEEIALLDMRHGVLQRVVGQLPESQRRAVDLAVFQGYSESEISQQLGEPLAKVRSELRATMRFLRHRLSAVLGTWAANI